ncbi:MAG TPA: hypothetical protein VFW68_00915 [Rhodocyclaceae bacterium]|nr:hypothetical protein [Rhodocyclaceae bacterium]
MTVIAVAIGTSLNSTASPFEQGQPMLIADGTQGISAYPLGTEQETGITTRVQQALSAPCIGGQGISRYPATQPAP